MIIYEGPSYLLQKTWCSFYSFSYFKVYVLVWTKQLVKILLNVYSRFGDFEPKSGKFPPQKGRILLMGVQKPNPSHYFM